MGTMSQAAILPDQVLTASMAGVTRSIQSVLRLKRPSRRR
jgi:hypothetical protein